MGSQKIPPRKREGHNLETHTVHGDTPTTDRAASEYPPVFALLTLGAFDRELSRAGLSNLNSAGAEPDG